MITFSKFISAIFCAYHINLTLRILLSPLQEPSDLESSLVKGQREKSSESNILNLQSYYQLDSGIR